MVDRRVVSTKLEQIEQYHGELADKRRELTRERFLKETTERRAVERMFENVIQASADLAQHIATDDLSYDGDASRDAIHVLSEHDIIDEATAQTLVAAGGFRNVLAHQYGQVDYERVFELLQRDLEVYDEFSRQVALWVREHG